jgi:RimJ/RimL family protein N-acetyltransferase
LWPMSSDARLATSADVPQLARAIARAFQDDPVATWSSPSDSFRPRLLERFHGARLRQLIARGEVWTTDELKSAALWAPPGLWNTTLREDLQLSRAIFQPRVLAHPVVLARSPMVALAVANIEREHPSSPEHWYLAVVGTDPAAQGRGLASTVLYPVLEQCDHDGVGAYLESSKESNIAYYARLGFRVTAEHRLPRGPSVWAMWRDPA